MSFFLRLLALVLFLIALLCGGCSVVFSGIALSQRDVQGVLTFLSIGFVPAGLLIWAGLALWRKTRKSGVPPPPDTFR